MQIDASSSTMGGFLVYTLLVVAIAVFFNNANSQLVPALITFGDSTVDVGNNDYIKTIFKADHPPYGKDFKNQESTGRFCNGKLATDLTAENLGFTSYAPPYLSPQATGKTLLLGANFASAGSGYDDTTAELSHVIPLSQQLQYFKEYQSKLANVAGSKNASEIIKGALYIIGSGNSDFLQNYYVNPFINKHYTADEYSSYLVSLFSSFVKSLYGLGARRIGTTSLAPIGCLPLARTIFGQHESGCVASFNTDAQQFNKKINAAATQLQRQNPGLKIVIFDIFKPLYDLVSNPKKFGFTEATKGCCGTGTVETTFILCNQKSGTCSNSSQYVFWDSVHPSEAANQVLADTLIIQGIPLIA